MKPSFALNLSHEGISLLHRTSGGWHHVGEAKLDDSQLSETLGFLRQTAIELEPGGLTSKLVIPDSQILYFETDMPDEAENIPGAIRQALSGKTPYAVDDLAFDWQVQGKELRVAAVARETLAEAESFAQEHRFNPVSFVAMPEADAFEGEPFFGTSSCIADILNGAATVEREAFAIKVIPLPEVEAPGATLSETATPDSASEEDPGTSVIPPDITQSEAATSDIIPPEEPDHTAAKTTELAETPDSALPETPPGDDGPQPDAKGTEDQVVPAFTSRREETPSGESSGSPTTPPDLPAPRLSVGAVRAGATADNGVTAAMAPDLPPVPEKAPSPPRKAEISADTTAGGPPPDTSPSDATTSDTPATAPLIARRDSVTVGGAAANGATMPSAPPPATAKPTDGAEAMTVFGARKSDKNRHPRYLGLVMTFVLILVMAIAAIWSTFFQPNGLSSLFGPGAPEPDPIIANLNGGDSRENPDGFRISPPDPTATPIPDADTMTTLPAAPADQAPPPPAETTLAEAEEIFADTGIWVRAPDHGAPPGTQTLDTIYIASPDPLITSHDALALPAFDPAPALSKPSGHFNPAPAGTEYVLDDRGFVIPSDEGTMNPDGIRVFAGRPPGATPVRPRNAAVPGTAELDGAALAALAGYRPAARPGNLQEIHERGLYGGLTRAELAARRPAPRPASPQSAPDVDATPTEFAVAISAIPPRRPGNIDELVAAARTNTENQEVQIASAAAAGVSAALGRAPEIPTHASVARAATQPNAINLRRISLIGVYGSASDRRALIRLRNGRYVKVEVGDRVDGGRVAAIGDHSLQYVKGGRNVTLAMPET